MACKKGFVLCILLLITLHVINVLTIEEDVLTKEESHDSPYETQTARCTITSGDIEASAQASISKTLTGVCGTDDMLNAFRTLETKMLEEIAYLREMIRDSSFKPPPIQFSNYKVAKPETIKSKNTETKTALTQVTETTPSTSFSTSVKPTSTTPSNIVFPRDEYDDEEDTDNISNTNSMTSNSDLVKLYLPPTRNSSLNSRLSSADHKLSQPIAFKPIDQPTEKKFLTGGLRDYEVYRFNNTVISSGDTKVFKYFWKIEHFTKRIRAASDMSKAIFSSAVFVISGLNLRLNARVATKTDVEVLYVQLEQLASTDGAIKKTANVILLSGKMYDQVETNKFFRHKIVILNQDEPFSDMISSDLTNTNSTFEAPLSSLTTEPYLKDDKLLIKVIIFL